MAKRKGELLTTTSDKKFIEGLEKKALVQNYNNCSTFGMNDCKGTKASVNGSEITRPIDMDEDDFCPKNDPRNNGRKTAYSHTEWAEHGFHITTRP